MLGVGANHHNDREHRMQCQLSTRFSPNRLVRALALASATLIASPLALADPLTPADQARKLPSISVVGQAEGA